MCFSSNNGVRKYTFSIGREQSRTCSRFAEARKPARHRTAVRSICISSLPCPRSAQWPRPDNKKAAICSIPLREYSNKFGIQPGLFDFDFVEDTASRHNQADACFCARLIRLWLRPSYSRSAKCKQACFCSRLFVSLAPP